MRDDESNELQDGEAYDAVAEVLQRLRANDGFPSYAEIVTRVAAARQHNEPGAHAPARSTVYDTFKFGRRRVDVALVLEIARALGASEQEYAELRERCLSARGEVRSAQAAVPPQVVAALPAVLEARGGSTRQRYWITCIAISLAVVAANMFGHGVVAWLGLPLYLDMIGTAVAAVALGPWWGVAVALATNVLATSVNSEAAIPFALVNAVGALVWGYGVRTFGMGRTLPRYFVLNIFVAIACTLTAVPIIMLLFHGETGHASESVMHTLARLGGTPVMAVFSANLLTSLADKLISGFVALVVVTWLTRWVPRQADAAAQGLVFVPTLRDVGAVKG